MRDVEIHWLRLDVPPERQAELEALLSPEERARAALFHFAPDSTRFIVCRGNLRELLSVHLAVPPTAIELVRNRYGKPETAGVHFNVSHSGNLALIAISRTRVVGIDIERVNRAFAHEKIPERFFAPTEVRALRALPEADQLKAFFTIWTRKEAYIKALGEGLSHPLASFDALEGVEGWEIESLNAPLGYAAAVAATALSRPA